MMTSTRIKLYLVLVVVVLFGAGKIVLGPAVDAQEDAKKPARRKLRICR